MNYTPNCFALQKTTCDGKKVDMLILIHISAHFNCEIRLQLLFSVRNIFRIYPQYNIKQTFFIGENKVKKCQKQEASLTQWIRRWWNVCLTYLYQKRFLTKHIHHHPKTSDCQEPENYILIRNKLMSELILISSIISQCSWFQYLPHNDTAINLLHFLTLDACNYIAIMYLLIS